MKQKNHNQRLALVLVWALLSVLLINGCGEYLIRAIADLSVYPGKEVLTGEEVVINASDSIYTGDGIDWYSNDHPIGQCNGNDTCKLTFDDEDVGKVRIKVEVTYSGNALNLAGATTKDEETLELSVSSVDHRLLGDWRMIGWNEYLASNMSEVITDLYDLYDYEKDNNSLTMKIEANGDVTMVDTWEGDVSDSTANFVRNDADTLDVYVDGELVNKLDFHFHDYKLYITYLSIHNSDYAYDEIYQRK